MADHTRRNEQTKPRDTPASKEAREQRQSGMQSAPRGAGETGGSARQPRQGSNRNEGHGPAPQPRRGYEAVSAPSDQGQGDPAPARGTASDSQQGLAASNRSSGSHHTHGERGEHEASHEPLGRKRER